MFIQQQPSMIGYEVCALVVTVMWLGNLDLSPRISPHLALDVAPALLILYLTS
jgi:hypothetical protein